MYWSLDLIRSNRAVESKLRWSRRLYLPNGIVSAYPSTTLTLSFHNPNLTMTHKLIFLVYLNLLSTNSTQYISNSRHWNKLGFVLDKHTFVQFRSLFKTGFMLIQKCFEGILEFENVSSHWSLTVPFAWLADHFTSCEFLIRRSLSNKRLILKQTLMKLKMIIKIIFYQGMKSIYSSFLKETDSITYFAELVMFLQLWIYFNS